MPAWLKDAIFYEVYPQSFYDTNADGVGDLPGITEKLPYIKELGANAIWLNPFFDSPMRDAGYDVRDYRKVSPRYGNLDDAKALFEKAHELGIHVIVDLVPGHTSEEHAWFLESKKAEPNELSGRYIWTNSAFTGIQNHPYIGGESPRAGVYMLNFFKCQPALNYGWGKVTEKWQSAADSKEALATREALFDICRFWLDLGCDGFRVDMADSLVKDDEDKALTGKLWKELRAILDAEYPEAVLISEWSNPRQSLTNGGFHSDFYLDHEGNGINALLRAYGKGFPDRSILRGGSNGDIFDFLREYLPKYYISRRDGYISFITGNHDTPRISRFLSTQEVRLAMGLIFTLPGVPFLYYGDEIGMRYDETVPTKEGGYHRTGSRTPMQWNGSKNLGFSKADESLLYLPVDGAADAPTVADQAVDPGSLYNFVKALFALRKKERELQADGKLTLVYAAHGKFPFVFRRGDLLLVCNPSLEAVTLTEGDLKAFAESVLRDAEETALYCPYEWSGPVLDPVKYPASELLGDGQRLVRVPLRNLEDIAPKAEETEGCFAGRKALLVTGSVRCEGGTLNMGPQSFSVLR